MDTKTSVEKLSFEDYKARPGINNSSLNHFRRSPAHYKAYTELPDKKTPAMGFGLVVHKLVFECSEALPRLAVGPTKGRDTQKWIAMEADRPDLLLVTEDEQKQLVGMVGAIQKHKKLMELLKGGHAEQSLFAVHPATGLQLKGRLDFICDDGKTILDLKTCQDARVPAFERNVAKYNWAMQAAYYRTLAKLCSLTHTRFLFVSIEKVKPFGIGLHELEVVSMGYATDKNEQALKSLKECQDTNLWPCYGQEINTISLPMYAIELEEDLI